MNRNSKVIQIILNVLIITTLLSSISFNCYASESLYLTNDFWNFNSKDSKQLNISHNGNKYNLKINCYKDTENGLGLQVIINNANLLGNIEITNPTISYYISNDNDLFYALFYSSNYIDCNHIDYLDNYGFTIENLNNSYIINSFIKYNHLQDNDNLTLYLTLDNERYLLLEYDKIEDIKDLELLEESQPTVNTQQSTVKDKSEKATTEKKFSFKEKENKVTKYNNKGNIENNKYDNSLNNNTTEKVYDNTINNNQINENANVSSSDISSNSKYTKSSKSVMVVGGIILLAGIMVIIMAIMYRYLERKIKNENN